MIDKTLSLSDAVRYVRDGHTIALGGMTIYRRPVAFVQALITTDNPPRKLTLFSFTAGLASDMLVGAGMVERIRTCYLGGASFGLAPNFTKSAGDGNIEIIEESEASIANGLRAKMAGVSFMPSLAWQGTDMFSVRPDVRIIEDPYNGRDLTAFPAIGCDVAVIHVLKADRFGNCRLGGNPTIDHELTLVADAVIITAEEVVDSLETNIDFSGLPVSAVVHLPQGAWPTSCYPTYPIDGDEILRYIDACNKGKFDAYIRRLSQ
jgi:glutaconate CoA-transferase subunit A